MHTINVLGYVCMLTYIQHIHTHIFTHTICRDLEKKRGESRRTSDDEIQTLQLALGRLRARQIENDLVYFTLSGACVLFKS